MRRSAGDRQVGKDRLAPCLDSIIRTHDVAALRAIIGYKPKTFAQWRVQALVLTILDTGCRIEEVPTARGVDFDFDNLLLTVLGKGRKERRVPFSLRAPPTRFA